MAPTRDEVIHAAVTRSLPVPEGLDGLRVDAALARLFGVSRTSAVGLIEGGDVLVDGECRSSPTGSVPAPGCR
ncbi:MAG: S4 domain-containing protein [Geodermatophilaceae bacterium]